MPPQAAPQPGTPGAEAAPGRDLPGAEPAPGHGMPTAEPGQPPAVPPYPMDPTTPAYVWGPAAPAPGTGDATWAASGPWQPGAPVWPGQPFAGWSAAGLDPADPLVTPPGAGLTGWFDRCVGAVRRGWRLLLPILLLTQVLPAILVGLLTYAVDPTAKWETATADDPAALPDGFVGDLATLFAVAVGGAVVFGLVQSVGWAAGTWVIARQAAGEPVDLAGAFRHGLRRAPGLWGWTLLIGLLIAVGVCFCVLPGVYLAFALSLAGPVYLFERQAPIARSFRMFHDRLGLVLGRVALIAAVVIVVSGAAGVLEGMATMPFGAAPLESPGTAVGLLVVLTITALLALPAHLAQQVGLVVTYAEQRAHEAPVNAARLAAELG
ncbi:hypothetical protein [Micromonospora sp. NPDC126480]|uniref:hypothetical protein n=1 Tax=Micromonospora sp. NPDC126480 TaxID=3155312 RepID=UPI00332756D8